MKGLRIILTNKCNRRCSFCYQKNFNDTISLEQLTYILNDLNYIPDYITVMGGEIFCLENYIQYLNQLS